MQNLVLVGFSCSGKSTIGRSLARRLHLRFVDTDRLVEAAAGRSIPQIFQEAGEATFRQLEAEAIASACAGSGQVISTGGGAFVDPGNRARLSRGNLVVHLQVRPETVVQRLRASRGGRPRPLLDGPDPLQRVRELMERRRSSYQQAHVTIVVDGRSTYDLVREIARRWTARQQTARRQVDGGEVMRPTPAGRS